MPIDAIKGGTLGTFNVGLAAAIPMINPLAAQLDAMIGFALGPLQADLAAQFNAAVALQATLTLQIGDPTAGLQLAIAALAQLQAALTAALTLPSINMSLSAELSASAALAASLSIKIGGIKLLIEAALAIKIPAIELAANMAANLTAGPFYIVTFSGDSLATTGGLIAAEFAGGLDDGVTTPILPTQEVFGVLLVSSVPSASAALSAIIMAPP